MKIGLWNIDHPEYYPSSTRRHQRYKEITTYLNRQHCDMFIITEANAAIQMADYRTDFSTESPFLNKNRYYEPPNKYHQVGIYSMHPLERVEIAEPINGLLCKTIWNDSQLFIYGNVVTIKDQWKKDSDKTYADRLEEQLEIFGKLASMKFIIGGDFNLRLGWPQKRKAHQRLKEFVNIHGLIWPTEERTETVQHIIHSPDLVTTVTIDSSVQHGKENRNSFSDHPFLLVDVKNA
ncbi:MAG: endonuclease/exonuclease/phosphatase family protein [Desulfobulbaceae bacterium]|nr:endonuclease/exonuclease/phosphatase family protein [Desulfobulbaceae bacterium]